MRFLFACLTPLLFSACASTPATEPAPAGGDGGVLRFSGTVRAIDNGCFADGVCSVTVDHTRVITLVGWSQDIWGQRDNELELGQRAEVLCRVTADGCTLNGSAGYFVRRAP